MAGINTNNASNEDKKAARNPDNFSKADLRDVQSEVSGLAERHKSLPIGTLTLWAKLRLLHKKNKLPSQQKD